MKFIILDRDGVINEDSDAFVKSPAEFIPIPGSLEAIGRLSQAGYTIVVATNQSGIARGYYDQAMLQTMHDKLATLLIPVGGHIDAFFVCPHGPDDHCDCRKPKTGLFQQIATQYQINLAGIPAVGDSLRDLQAAITVGAKPILVKTGKGQRTLDKYKQELLAIPVYANLADYVNELLNSEGTCTC
jgi:D-glycero-D-manno-heptose 1,7-bisphosphate phosphatase